VSLAELAPPEAEWLIRLKLEQFFGCEAQVPPGFVARITAQAAGNPFYIEELLNYLQDRGIRPTDSESLAALDLPSSLYSLILSRMDQLTQSQQTTMKVASVIGRLFPAAMVWGVYPQLGSVERVKADLQALTDADLTLMDAQEPELAYLFKHIITHEVAYESLLYATRAMLHEQIGQYLERTYGETLDQYVSLLAYHYEHSDNEPKKREYLLKAGEAAQADHANAAAIDWFQKVLPLLEADEQVSVLLKLGKVLELIGEWQAARERYEQALALAEELDDRPAQAWCQTAIGALLGWKQGQYAEASVWLDRARAGFEGAGDQTGMGQVLHIWGTLATLQGDLDNARARYEESLVIRRDLEDRPNAAALLSNLGIVARSQGNYETARALHEEALALRTELGDKWAIANSCHNLGNVYLDEGNYLAARTQLEAAVSLLREIGDRQAIANALHSLANVMRDQGDHAASRAQYQESLTILRELGDRWIVAHLLEDMGVLATLQAQPERALRLAGAAAALREEMGSPLSSAYQKKLDKMLEPARQAAGGTATERAIAQGRAMALEQAMDYAFGVLAEPGSGTEEIEDEELRPPDY
jgi:predicted ATPase